MKIKQSLRKTSLAAMLLALVPALRAESQATLSSASLPNLNLRIYGFLETDYITDGTQGLLEEQDNNLIARPGTYAGDHPQTMMSVRNSRLGADLTVPDTDSGWSTKAKIEIDLTGNQAANTVPAATGGAQSERDFFNNPALRVRHAYLELQNKSLGWDFKLGQTWSLLGWQPYYFPAEAPIQPAVGQLYRRFVQARAMNIQNWGDFKLETAGDVAKPAELRSDLPEAHAGLRLSTGRRQAAVSCGGSALCAGDKSIEDMSIAISGAWIPLKSNIGNEDGYAGAIDLFLPILSSEGGSRANNLSLTAEGSVGRGTGGLELAGLTFGLPTVAAAGANTNIDSGMASTTAGGRLEMIQVRTERIDLMYVPPWTKWNVDAGVAQVQGLNLEDFAFALANRNAVADNLRYVYGSVSYDPLAWVRLTALYSVTNDRYLDGIHATNSRLWFASFFMF